MEQVKEMLAVLRRHYLQDLPTHIDDIEKILLSFERDGFEIDACRQMYRLVHSLKGSGATYGFDFLTEICHPYEDWINRLIEQPQSLSRQQIEIALAYVDLLRQTGAVYARDAEPDSQMRDRLQALRQRHSPHPHSAILVDGSDVVISLLRDVVSEQGFRVEVVRDGYVALGRLLVEPFDLLITGFENQRLNGLALISAVQHAGTRANKTKMVLLTSNDHLELPPSPCVVLKKNAALKEQVQVLAKELAAQLDAN